MKDGRAVNITTKSRYAVRALVELAEQSEENGGQPVPLSRVANSRQVPMRFLEQLFARLRRAGVVRSHRGVAGGFSFARSPDEITVLEVVQLLDGPLGASLCALPQGCERREYCAVSDVWLQVKQATEAVLAQVTIGQLTAREKERRGRRRGAGD